MKDKLRSVLATLRPLTVSLELLAQETARQPEKTRDGGTNDKHVIGLEQLEVKSREWSGKVWYQLRILLLLFELSMLATIILALEQARPLRVGDEKCALLSY